MKIQYVAIAATAMSITLVVSQPGLAQRRGNNYNSNYRGNNNVFRPQNGEVPNYRPQTNWPNNTTNNSNVTTRPYYVPNNGGNTTTNYPYYSNYPNYPATTTTPSYTPTVPNITPSNPQTNYVPVNPPPTVTNVLPKPVREPVVVTHAAANTASSGNVLGLTDTDIQSAQSQITDENNQIANKITDEVANDTINEIVNDPAFNALPDGEKNALLQAVKAGDPAKVNNLLTADGLNTTQTGGKLFVDAQTVQDAQNLAKDASNGTATQQQIDNLAAVMNVHYGFTDTAGDISSLAANNKMAALLQTAKPGDTTVPSGNNVPMMLVSSLPSDAIYPLGNGAVMIGTGGQTEGTLVGEGNVAEVTGQPVTVDQPAPNSQADLVTSGTLLTNGADKQVNYQINGNAFSMDPGYQQTLPSGQTWVVAFDRGGSFGEARYTLGDGTYQFTSTDHGWDVQKQSFSATLDNSFNKTPFNYVYQNAQQTVAAGQTAQLTGDYPVIVRFDDGKGQTVQKQLASGSYSVAARPGAGVDLYPPDAVKPPFSGPRAFSVVNGKQQRLPPGFRLFNTSVSLASTQTQAVDKTSDGVKLFGK